jgi:hypothetical protein
MANILGVVTINQTSFFELDANPLLAATPGIGVGDFCLVDGSTGIWQKTGSGNLDFTRLDDWASFATQATVNGTSALTAASDSVRVYTGTTAGQIITLPNATALVLGRVFLFINDSSVAIQVRTFTNSPIITILPESRVRVILTDKTTATGVWTTDSNPISIDAEYLSIQEDDFTGTTAASRQDWTVTAAGTGASGQPGTYGVNSTERAFGVIQIDTGTTGTGRATLNRLVNQVQLGYYSITQEWRLAPEALSTATQRFMVTFGFIDNTGAMISTATGADHTDGVFFKYRDDLNSGQWICACRQGGTETAVNTTVAAATSYSRFRIEINETASQALFYINNNLVATISTNLPATTGQLTGIGAKIEKTTGLTQANLAIDYFYQRSAWSTGR